MGQSKKYRVGAIETTFEILETLKQLESAGATEIAEAVEAPVSTVYNHLMTLERNEYVVKTGEEYQISLKFLEFGEQRRNRTQVYKLARPQVKELADETEEVATFMIEEHGRGVSLCREGGDNAVRIDNFPGRRVELHCTGLGKAMLAFFPEEKVDSVIERHGLPAKTEHTITDEENLRDELAEIRERGYAFDRQERHRGLRCVAAPVQSDDGSIIGAISVSAPRARMTGERFTETMPEAVLRAKNVIEVNTTYSSPDGNI
jgi:IclR family acetate operon transcriptional repressor